MDSLAPRSGPAQIPASEWSVEHRRRSVNYPVFVEREQVEVKVVSFAAGGFELTARTVDLQERVDRDERMATDLQARFDLGMRGGGFGVRKRKPIAERCEADKLRALRRAKVAVRHACRQIGATHLLTLTTRQDRNTPEELAGRWRRFCRLVEFKLGRRLTYVAQPEPHPKNLDHWHLHVALPGFLPVNVARPIWWACCGGRGEGNIDIKYIKVRDGLGDGERARRVASYISKYMTKELVFDHRPDKKNYWRSRFELPGVRRCFLVHARPGDLDGMRREVCERFGIVWEPQQQGGWFFFPDGSGFWYSHAGGGAQAPPPF